MSSGPCRGAGVAGGGGVRKNKRRASSVIGLIETRASFGGSSEKPGFGSLGDTVRREPLPALPHSEPADRSQL